MGIEDKIKALIHSGKSGYFIAKESGVSQATVSRLISGEYHLDKISLGNAVKLEQLFDKLNALSDKQQ